MRNRPFRKAAAGIIDLGSIAQALDNTQLTQLNDAIGKKDKDRGIKLYDEAMQGCFAFHKASEKPYLVLRRPEVPEVNVINFADAESSLASMAFQKRGRHAGTDASLVARLLIRRRHQASYRRH